MNMRILGMLLIVIGLAACGQESRQVTDARGRHVVSDDRDLQGNRSIVNASNSTVVHTTQGIGNVQSADVVNSGVSQTARGAWNEQSVQAENTTQLHQSEVGIGNSQAMIVGKGAKVSHVSQSQTGLFNTQIMRVGKAP